jgi:hypothetical protein
MALAGAFLWGRAALLPSCYFVSRTVDYTNYGSMSLIAMLQQLRSGRRVIPQSKCHAARPRSSTLHGQCRPTCRPYPDCCLLRSRNRIRVQR